MVDDSVIGRIAIQEVRRRPLKSLDTEIVERKGLGHPDSVADGIAEAISRELSKFYLRKYGRILHHNVDKLLIVAGAAEPSWGGGRVLRPAKIFLAGRATNDVNGEPVPVEEISVRAARTYLDENFRHLDVDAHVEIFSEIGPGSVDLRTLFEKGKVLANDTSIGVGYAPMTDLERVVLETERFMNDQLREDYPELGEDIKVMGVRRGGRIDLTVAAAFVDRFFDGPREYLASKENVLSEIRDFASSLTNLKLDVKLNTADDPGRGVFYITVTGLSMESGDDGMVGRGNRVNGLITPYRPMSLEAAAGKNPVTHVGKLYNVLAFRIAEKAYEIMGTDAAEIYVKMVSRIGHPISEPQIVSVEIVPEEGADVKRYFSDIRDLVAEQLEKVYELKFEFLEGRISVF